MPAMAKKSPIADRLEKELGGEFEAHKNDETKYGSGSDLPAGINGGIAQLVEMKVGEYNEGDNKGKLFMCIAGIVKLPVEFNGIKIEGLRTQLIVKLFANNNRSKDEMIAKACNEVRKMGGMIGEIKARDLPVLMDAIKVEAPHFRFRTYAFTPDNAKPDDAPIIVHEFRGKIDNYESNGAAGGVIDNTGAPADGGEGQVPDDDWDVVVAAANNDDGGAQAKLQDTCKALGMTEAAVNDIGTWEELAEIIKSGGAPAAGSETTTPAAGDWKPEKNDVFTLKLKGMKSAQKLTVVQMFKETVHLKNEAGKDFKGLAWSASPPSIDGVEI